MLMPLTSGNYSKERIRKREMHRIPYKCVSLGDVNNRKEKKSNIPT